MKIMRQPARNPGKAIGKRAAVPKRRQNRMHRISIRPELRLQILAADQLEAPPATTTRMLGQRGHQLPGVLRHPSLGRWRIHANAVHDRPHSIQRN